MRLIERVSADHRSELNFTPARLRAMQRRQVCTAGDVAELFCAGLLMIAHLYPRKWQYANFTQSGNLARTLTPVIARSPAFDASRGNLRRAKIPELTRKLEELPSISTIDTGVTWRSFLDDVEVSIRLSQTKIRKNPLEVLEALCTFEHKIDTDTVHNFNQEHALLIAYHPRQDLFTFSYNTKTRQLAVSNRDTGHRMLFGLTSLPPGIVCGHFLVARVAKTYFPEDRQAQFWGTLYTADYLIDHEDIGASGLGNRTSSARISDHFDGVRAHFNIRDPRLSDRPPLSYEEETLAFDILQRARREKDQVIRILTNWGNADPVLGYLRGEFGDTGLQFKEMAA